MKSHGIVVYVQKFCKMHAQIFVLLLSISASSSVLLSTVQVLINNDCYLALYIIYIAY